MGVLLDNMTRKKLHLVYERGEKPTGWKN